MLAMNVQILRHTEYKNTSTEPPQILLSDLRFYCPTSEFTVRPQNLQYDLRIYSTTSDSTVRPQNLQYDLRIYSTTSEFTVRPQSFTVRPGFLEVQILVQPDPAEVYYLLKLQRPALLNVSQADVLKVHPVVCSVVTIPRRIRT